MRRYLTDPVLLFLTTYTALMVAECVALRRTLHQLQAKPVPADTWTDYPTSTWN